MWVCVKMTTNLSFYNHPTPWQTACHLKNAPALAGDMSVFATKRQLDFGEMGFKGEHG
jgi:hypothetical protein